MIAVQRMASRRRQVGWSALTALALLLAQTTAVRAAERDDRPAIEAFVATGVVTSRSLQEDLARSLWPPKEMRAAVARAYGVSTVRIDRLLDSPQGRALLQRQLPWWSPELSPAIRLAALQAAILADSRDGSISLVGLLQHLPVRFALADGGTQPPSPVGSGSCGCPEACGGSALAHLAFLMACLQAGSNAGSN